MCGSGFRHAVRGDALVFGRLLGGTFVSDIPIDGHGHRDASLLACKILGSIQGAGSSGFPHSLPGGGLAFARLLRGTFVGDSPLGGIHLRGGGGFLAHKLLSIRLNNIIVIGSMLGAGNILVPGNGFPHKVRGVGLVFGRMLGGTFVSGFPVGRGGLRGGCLLACEILSSIQVAGNIVARGSGFLHGLGGGGLVFGRLLGGTFVSDCPLCGGRLRRGGGLLARKLLAIRLNIVIVIGSLLSAGNMLVCGSGFPYGMCGLGLVFGSLLGGTFVSDFRIGGGGLRSGRLLACKILGSIQVASNILARSTGFHHSVRAEGLVFSKMLGGSRRCMPGPMGRERGGLRLAFGTAFDAALALRATLQLAKEVLGHRFPAWRAHNAVTRHARGVRRAKLEGSCSDRGDTHGVVSPLFLFIVVGARPFDMPAWPLKLDCGLRASELGRRRVEQAHDPAAHVVHSSHIPLVVDVALA